MHIRLVMAAVVLAIAGGIPAAAQDRWAAPVVADGMTFPVARSSWFSLINFRDDWHAPRLRFVGGKWRQIGVHEGNDIFAEPGTPVRAILGGVVENIGWTFYSGWRVGIRGSDGRYWFYAHLSAFPPDLDIGDVVATGDLIGAVGNTGYGDNPGHSGEFIYHLHVGIQEPSGRWMNPYPLMKRLYKAAADERS